MGFKFLSSGGSGSGKITVLKDGVEVGQSTRLNFEGSPIVQLNDGQADVFIGVSPPSFEILSFTNNIGTAEVGQEVNSITFNWSYNDSDADPSAQSIDNGVQAIPTLSTRSLVYNPITPITSASPATVSYLLSATRNAVNRTRSTSFNFRFKRYWGVTSNANLGLSAIDWSGGLPMGANGEFATARQMTKNFTFSNNYWFFAFPVSFGVGSPTQIKIGSFEYSGIITRTVNLTNESGHVESYYVLIAAEAEASGNLSIEVL